VTDFVRRWSEATEISAVRFIAWLGIAASSLPDGQSRAIVYWEIRERMREAGAEHSVWRLRTFLTNW